MLAILAYTSNLTVDQAIDDVDCHQSFLTFIVLCLMLPTRVMGSEVN